ncbi:MAG: DUF309 domain-containing protein [Candidatus Thermoplasmatota archaeon]|nr:DUF309 domain-containing protein [Candidatus Thermoplasmatota archaeon]
MSDVSEEAISRLKRIREALEKGSGLYNSGHFFECHEVLEKVWLAENGDVKVFLQGIIKIAAAFHHFRKETFRGMLDLLVAGRDLVDRFRPFYRGIELEEFLSAIDAWIPRARRLANGELSYVKVEIPHLIYIS